MEPQLFDERFKKAKFMSLSMVGSALFMAVIVLYLKKDSAASEKNHHMMRTMFYSTSITLGVIAHFINKVFFERIHKNKKTYGERLDYLQTAFLMVYVHAEAIFFLGVFLYFISNNIYDLIILGGFGFYLILKNMPNENKWKRWLAFQEQGCA